MKGKKLPQIGARRDQHHGGDAGRWLAFQSGEIDIEYQLSEVAPTFMTDDGKLKPEFAQQRHQARSQRRSGDHLHLLQHAGQDRRRAEPVRRFQQGEDRAAPRDGDGLQRRRRDPHHPQRPGGRAQYPIPPGVVGPRPELPEQRSRTTRARRTRCSTASATEKARTATARCRTASRSCIRYYVDADRA